MNSRQGKRQDRRLSGTNSTSLAGWPGQAAGEPANRRPLTAVLSEEYGTNYSPDPGAPRQSEANPAARQSFLKKLNWSETKSSLGGSRGDAGAAKRPEGSQCQPQVGSSFVLGTECDRTSKNDLDGRRDGDDKDKHTKQTGVLDQTGESSAKTERQPPEDELSKKARVTAEGATGREGDNDDEDDDDNQVVPSWPSRSDTLAKQSTKFVQHKVYSLKDYSQVANPSTELGSSATSQQNVGSSQYNVGRLLKSVSQDRKMSPDSKRMSECLYLSGPQAASAASKKPNPSVPGRTTSGSFSMSPADGRSLLTPANGRQHQAALLSESRIDRMRKLFVPLSLRGGSSAKGSASGSSNAAGQPRLSFQSGASMLNKPHHLMHVVYRSTGTGTDADSLLNRKMAMNRGFRVYGCPLHMANNIFPITCFGKPDVYRQSHIPYVLARLCSYIEDNSSDLTHEGIFRVSGNARLMEKLRTLFDRLGDAPLELESVDVATSASMLKMYLRELPEPLIPTRLNYYFITLAKKYSSYLSKDNFPAYKTKGHPSSTDQPPTAESRASSERQRLAFTRDLTKLLRKLPIENYNLLKYLACFLFRISLKQQYNKMCAEALGIVFGPNIFRIRSESYKGLKEQELSNQIMASIISNYKCIFDSELTDPLGNLIDSSTTTEPSQLTGGDRSSSSSRKQQQPVPTSQQQNSTPLKEVDANRQSESAAKSSLPATASAIQTHGGGSHPMASTSEVMQGSNRDDTDHECCPKHCQGCLLNSGETDDLAAGLSSHQLHRHQHRLGGGEKGDGDYCDDDDDDDDDVDDDDDDDDCDDEESYTPSTGTGSYCSSMDSETLESTYDGIEPPLDAVSNISSSECASDTSYTPTSSHSDSEPAGGAAGSFYGETSSFDSSPSAGRVLEASPETGEGTSPKEACLECKRRESVHKGSIINELEEGSIEKASAAGGGGQFAELAGAPHTHLPTGSSHQHGATETSGVALANESSQAPAATRSRRRRKDGSIRAKPPVAVEIASSEISGDDGIGGGGNQPLLHTRVTSQETRTGGTLGKRTANVSSSSNATSRQEAGGTPKSRHSAGNSKQGHRSSQFLRRRSSSASSLTRVKHKRDQMAALQRQIVRDGLSHHKSAATNAVASAVSSAMATKANQGDKRRLHAETVRERSSRRSRHGKSHVNRRLPTSGAADASLATAQDSSKSCPPRARDHAESRAISGRNKTLSERCQLTATSVLPDVLLGQNVAALNQSNNNNDERPYFTDCTDLLSAQYLEELECDKYFLLRSFNSDETLLRSLNYCNEFLHQVGPKSRRRFSGYDYSAPKVGLQMTDQIYEGYVGDEQVVARETVEVDNVQNMEPSSAGSFVSLLDNRITGFRKSELSINEDDQSEDPILTQMKALKDFLRALKRCHKVGSTQGYNRDTEATLLELAQCPNRSRYSTPCAACRVDHLSAKSLAQTLGKSLESASSGASMLTEELNNILTVKISLLKKRYNDLKNIREHFLRNHAAESSKTAKAGATSVTSDSKLEEQSLEVLKSEQVSSVVESKAQVPIGHEQRPEESTDSGELVGGLEAKASESPLSERQGNTCSFGSLCPVEFVFNIEKRLASKRSLGAREIRIYEMNDEQLQGEKLELQKNLLRYEHWFGRPVTSLEFSLVGHLYERYRAVKVIKSARQGCVDPT